MTEAESMLGDGIDALTDAFDTTSDFKLEGHSTTFRGVISEQQMDVELAAGGLATNFALVVVARKDQFETAGIVPEKNKRLTYRGRQWVITGMPFEHDDPVSYHLQCDAPQARK